MDIDSALLKPSPCVVPTIDQIYMCLKYYMNMCALLQAFKYLYCEWTWLRFSGHHASHASKLDNIESKARFTPCTTENKIYVIQYPFVKIGRIVLILS